MSAMFECESVCMYSMGMNRGWLGKNGAARRMTKMRIMLTWKLLRIYA